LSPLGKLTGIANRTEIRPERLIQAICPHTECEEYIQCRKGRGTLMRICIYEDAGWQLLEPIALTRPAFALRLGAERLFERQLRQFVPDEFGFWVRPALVELWKQERPGRPVNDETWLREAPTLWMNARWLPPTAVGLDASLPHLGVIGDHVAYALLPIHSTPDGDEIGGWLESWKHRLPVRNVGGEMIEYLWDVVDRNGRALREDAIWFRLQRGPRSIPNQVAVSGPPEDLIIAPDAVVEPFVFVDTTGGPVMIDKGAIVHSFSRLEGPCYVGRDSWIVGAKLRAGSSIGPCSRMGGEIEASIVQGYSNKYHEGFLGHSYIGEWVNLAAATQTSDLRNDYDVVRVNINGQRVNTGRPKIGSYIGDHTKTGLGALLNTGSNIGAFVNVLPSGTYSPQVIPSFTQLQHGHLVEQWDLRKLFNIASRVLQRRGKKLTDAHKDFYYTLFDGTAERRRKIFRDAEVRRLRRSMQSV